MNNTKRRRVSPEPDYRIPAMWDCWGYDGLRRKLGKEIAVDPEAYLAACVRRIKDRSLPGRRYAGRSLSRIQGVRAIGGLKVRDGSRRRRAGDWIRRQIMYGMMIRTSTAWDHDGDGRLRSRRRHELGSFLKSILLLPHLVRMGVTVLYLLPVVKVSRLFRKGELGCPYSAKSFLELDPDQYDASFGETYGDIAAQFGLFIECAHRLGMRVMLDVAPRTAARDSDWILDDPQWFYWIDRRYARGFNAPRLPGIEYRNPVPGRLAEIYDVPAVRLHLRKFRLAPSVTRPQKWANFVRRARARPPQNLLAEIARHFGVTTPPGFSDCINDTQPPWSDVTYLRLFLDHPQESARHLPDPDRQPPYVLFDTAKASLFEGRRPNKALWTKLAGIIPFYQRFGVDGARVDMAHALPARLERTLLANPRRRDGDFCFLAEELSTHGHARACARGYNIIIGSSWYMQPRGHEGKMHEMLEELPRLRLPVMAVAETPDTPRAVMRRGGRKFSQQAVVVNCLLPNAVPMINSGMEVFERQPMNLGLDVIASGRNTLPRTDPLAGKLAFFDRFALHWGNIGGKQMVELIGRATALRKTYQNALTNRRAYFAPVLSANQKAILATGFRLGKGKGSLVMLANLDFARTRRTTVSGLRRARGAAAVVLQIHDSAAPTMRRGALSVRLSPGEVMIIRV